MTNQHGSHRFRERHLRRKVEGILEHDFLETLTVLRQEHVAHHNDSKKFLVFVGDKAVGNNCFPSEPPNLFGCFGNCGLWTENCQGRLHQASNRPLQVRLIPHPLLVGFRGSGSENRLPP